MKNPLKKIKAYIDNTALFKKKAEARDAKLALERAEFEKTREGQFRRAKFLIDEFHRDFVSDGCTADEIPKRFYRFQKRIRKEIKDKDVLAAMMRDLDTMEKAMLRQLNGAPPPEPPAAGNPGRN